MSLTKTKSLEEFYFQGGKSYQYGGEVPVILFPDPPTPSPTPTNTTTPTLTPTNTPTPSITQTITPSITPTITPTKTQTPTITPTPSSTPPALDPNAQAYIDAVINDGGTLTDLEKSAVNQLVLDLKSASIWTFWQAFYPFLGGTSGSTRWNLINPISGSSGNQIIWRGGMSFSSQGILGNSTDSGGLITGNAGGLNYGRVLGVYINDGLTATPTTEWDLGQTFPSPIKTNGISLGVSNKTTKYVNFAANTSFLTTTSGSYSNCMLLGQNSSSVNNTELWQDTTQLLSTPQTYQDVASTFVIGGSGTPDGLSIYNPSGRGYGTAFVSNQTLTLLDASQITDLYNAVYNFNNTLGRA